MKSGGAQIAATINRAITAHGIGTYVEPFCGGLSVTMRVQAPQRLASDACRPLITLYQAMQRGWTPPAELGPEEWERLRQAQDPADPLTAFAGFGCSFGGSWFGSYAKRYKYTDRWVTAAEAAASSLTKKLERCADVAFAALDYREAPAGGLTYCDPPYRGTMGYGAAADWEPEAFWGWAEGRARESLVAVSELQAPAGWVPLLTFDLQHRIATGSGGKRRDHLFVPAAQVGAWRERGEQGQLFGGDCTTMVCSSRANVAAAKAEG